MTQGFPAQGFGAPASQYQQPQQFAAPAPTPQHQQGMGAAPGGFFQTQDPHQQAQHSAPGWSGVGDQQSQPEPQQPVDTSGFWGGAASISFDAQKGYVKGTPRGGKILSKTISNQTKLGTGETLRWQDGSPRKQMVVTLQTNERADPQDNGQRQLFIKGDLPRAVREAFQKVGASDLSEGGWLYVAWVDEKPAKSAGYNPQKIYQAIYAPPGSPDPLAGQAPPTPQPSVAQQPQPGPIAQMPAQQSASMNAMWQGAQQMDPASFGQPQMPQRQQQPAAAQAFPQQQFAPQAPQPGTFQPGGQPQPVPGEASQQPAPPQGGATWSPFNG